MTLPLPQHPHRRFNPLTGEWVLVSPQRLQRPWQGQVEPSFSATVPAYDPACYLCPGNQRASGAQTDNYTHTYVFENDYPALTSDVPVHSYDEEKGELFLTENEAGICRVICFSPRHDLTLSRMTVPEIRRVVDLWLDQYRELGAREDIQYVQIFENRGAMMGASNPHPHGQVWASRSIPNQVRAELVEQEGYYDKHGVNLLFAYAQKELQSAERILAQNNSFLAVVPFWAVWPFEVMVLPLRHVERLENLEDIEKDDLAAMLQDVTSTYDSLFNTPFPYSMGLHPAPCDGKQHPEWQFHLHFYPPLLRSASIRKFMVGFELLGSPQRDLTPEIAAEMLRQAASRR